MGIDGRQAERAQRKAEKVPARLPHALPCHLGALASAAAFRHGSRFLRLRTAGRGKACEKKKRARRASYTVVAVLTSERQTKDERAVSDALATLVSFCLAKCKVGRRAHYARAICPPGVSLEPSALHF